MIDIGSLEIFLILVIALLVMGPQRLPEVAREIGRGIGKAKRMMSRFREDSQIDKHLDEFRSYVDLEDDMKEIKENMSPISDVTDSIKEVTGDIQNTLNPSISATTSEQNTTNSKDKRNIQPQRSEKKTIIDSPKTESQNNTLPESTLKS